ncbi:hypothetical protein BYT27DRAFT_7341542 [Phlegmacium glaucopus]|nr:hypothetical protein BYT27DRAFT_7341542 [Phlegmacium glaucopus]
MSMAKNGGNYSSKTYKYCGMNEQEVVTASTRTVLSRSYTQTLELYLLLQILTISTILRAVAVALFIAGDVAFAAPNVNDANSVADVATPASHDVPLGDLHADDIAHCGTTFYPRS